MTSYDVHVSHLPSIPVAVVRRQARASELARLVPKGCGVVWAHLRAHQLKGGRHVAIYWDGSIRLEVGVELDQPLPEGGDIVRSATPAGPAASTIHFGPYHALGVAHAAIRDWCAAHNHRLAGPNWEVYAHWQSDWDGDPSRIRTDVFYQLAADEELAVHPDTREYNESQAPIDQAICRLLAEQIDRGLPEAENKIWHAHPVWLLDGNPIVGYSKLKACIRLLFWSGQSFEEEGLTKEGSFKAAEARYTAAEQVDTATLQRWLAKARDIQWDYKNLIRRNGRLVRLS